MVSARDLVACCALVGAALVAGCASAPATKGTLHFGVAEAPEGRMLLWPAFDTEIPRFAYAGTLTGEANFRRDTEDKGRSLLRWLVGLDDEALVPVVLQRPTAGAVDARGRIYVTDPSRRGVFVFDEAAGELSVWEQATPGIAFVAPSGIAPNGNGEVFVADADLGLVARLDRDGNPRPPIGLGLLKRPTGLARDAERDILYVADTYAHDVKAFDRDGRLVATLGRRGEAPGEFNYPTHLAFARGELYVTDTMNSRVQVLRPDGSAAPRRIGTRGLFIGNLVRPKGVAVDGEGNVYVIESFYDTLLVFNRDGEFLMPIGGTGVATGRFYLPSGVWTDERNRVYIADMFNGRVVVFSFLGGG